MIRDKALALEAYARQALNRDAERKAIEIRIRAERRAGQLLKELKASGTLKEGRRKKLSSGTIVSTLTIRGAEVCWHWVGINYCGNYGNGLC